MSFSKPYAVILAGGKGTRLWPLSREHYPKQFVGLDGGQSSFQLTLQRLLKFFDPERCFVVLPEEYRFTVRNQIEFLSDVKSHAKKTLLSNLVLEPEAHNTLPAMLLAVCFIRQKMKAAAQDVFYVFPSDHQIKPVADFIVSLKKARALAQKGYLVLFGKRSSVTRNGYGYIVAGGSVRGAHVVRRFIEKPAWPRIQKLVKQKAYWNSGIFCFSQQTFSDQIRRYCPSLAAYLRQPPPVLVKAYARIPALSFDRAILEKTKEAVMIRFSYDWSDLVSWDNFLDNFGGRSANAKIGQALFVDSKNCFAYSRSRLIGMVGLKDVMAIDAGDALLLARRGTSDKIKTLVKRLNQERLGHSKDSTTVYRPWGYYTILHETPSYKVKEIGVYPKKFLSLQKHYYRSEHWNIVEGTVRVLIGQSSKRVRKNESIYVPRKARHQIFNPGPLTAKIIEVQIGDYLGEDDIVRYSEYQ